MEVEPTHSIGNNPKNTQDQDEKAKRRCPKADRSEKPICPLPAAKPRPSRCLNHEYTCRNFFTNLEARRFITIVKKNRVMPTAKIELYRTDPTSASPLLVATM